MRKLFYLLLLTIFISAIGYTCELQKQVVLNYLKYDFKGERLGSDVSVNIDKLTANLYEPAWDVITLITKYEIQSIKQDGRHAVVIVAFKNAWEIDREFRFSSLKDEHVEMHLQKTKKCWKVTAPFYQPHVDPIVALKHFGKLMEDGKKDNVDREYMEYMQSVLDGTRKYILSNKVQ